MPFPSSFARPPWRRTSTRKPSCRAAVETLECRHLLANFSAGPLVPVSGPSPFVECDAFDPALRRSVDAETEPWVVVNPANPDNIVAAYRQDITVGGGSPGLLASVSFDGGGTWRQVVIPGLTACSGGPYERASDPWLSFAPNGDLYFSSNAFDDAGLFPVHEAVLVSKLTDGGLTWGDPVAIARDPSPDSALDKETITADPTDARFAYAVWLREQLPPGAEHRPGAGPLGGFTGFKGPAMFSRTTDGGRTWEPPRVLYDPGANSSTQGNQIVVRPDGTLVDFFSESLIFKKNDGGTGFDLNLSLVRSSDRGRSWQPGGRPVRVAEMQFLDGFDPDTGVPVRNGSDEFGALFDVASDPTSGNLYAVWGDARFSGGAYNSVAFAMSTDGGRTWSEPVKINRTPTDIVPGDQQAFLPSIEVAADGTVGVTYYDFRNNTPAPGLPTDHWFIHSHPGADLTDPANWDDELRLTDSSFDMEKAPVVAGLFLGDYTGLSRSGDDFVVVFSQPQGMDPASAFFRRLTPLTEARAAVPRAEPMAIPLNPDLESSRSCVMRLKNLLNCRSGRESRMRSRSRYPHVERLEGRAVPASYSAASVPDLVAAINAANETTEADTITLAAGKTFTLTAVNNTADGPTGLPVVAAGEDMTVVGNGDVIERSTAVGTPAFRLLDVAPGGSLRLENLTIQGGLALGVLGSGTPAWSQGGAAYNRGTLTLSGVVVQDNTAQGYDGGQPWAPTQGGAAAGGGLYSEGALTLEGSTLRGNLAVGGHGAHGGIIADGYAYPGGPGGDGTGGGLYVGGGSVGINNSAFTANTARGGDGGDGAGLPKGVNNFNPTAGGDGGDGSGGAIYAASGSIAVRNTEITSSNAQGGAGGAGGAQGRRHAPDGANGPGVGGALYIVNPDASVVLDDFTLKHFRRNKASTSDGNIYGSYTRIP